MQNTVNAEVIWKDPEEDFFEIFFTITNKHISASFSAYATTSSLQETFGNKELINNLLSGSSLKWETDGGEQNKVNITAKAKNHTGYILVRFLTKWPADGKEENEAEMHNSIIELEPMAFTYLVNGLLSFIGKVGEKASSMREI